MRWVARTAGAGRSLHNLYVARIGRHSSQNRRVRLVRGETEGDSHGWRLVGESWSCSVGGMGLSAAMFAIAIAAAVGATHVAGGWHIALFVVAVVASLYAWPFLAMIVISGLAVLLRYAIGRRVAAVMSAIAFGALTGGLAVAADGPVGEGIGLMLLVLGVVIPSNYRAPAAHRRRKRRPITWLLVAGTAALLTGGILLWPVA